MISTHVRAVHAPRPRHVPIAEVRRRAVVVPQNLQGEGDAGPGRARAYARRRRERAEVRASAKHAMEELAAAIDAGDASYGQLRDRMDAFGTRLDRVRAAEHDGDMRGALPTKRPPPPVGVVAVTPIPIERPLMFAKHARLVGGLALAFSVLYLCSDTLEATRGGFSTGQLWLTLFAEAAIPFFVIGLYALQRPQIGQLGRISAAAYAYSYVFFTGTVIYALADGTKDFGALSHDLRPWMTIHGAVMLLAGLGFGRAVMRARVLPRWTGASLMAGVVLVSLSQSFPEGVQVLAAGIRDLGFAAMGMAVLQHAARPAPPEPRRTSLARPVAQGSA